MFLVEWCYGERSPIRDKRIDSDEELILWVETLKANGASFIVISAIGVC